MNDDSGIAAPIICNVIARGMGLDPERVWIRDENKVIPNDRDVFVVVGMIDSLPTSVTSSMVQDNTVDPPVQKEVNRVNSTEFILIDIASRSTAAKTRHWEILAALQSIYGQQQQEANYCKFFRIPRNFLNTSYAEGGSQLNRYSITIACAVWYSKEAILPGDAGDYYDDFTLRLDTEQTLDYWDIPGDAWDIPGDRWSDGLIVFEITQEGILP